MPERLSFDDLNIKLFIGNVLFNILYINYEPPIPSWLFPSHSHSSYELHFVPNGRGVLRVNHQEFPIEPGTFYFTGPGLYHEQIADRADPMSEFSMNFELKTIRRTIQKNDIFLQTEADEVVRPLLETNFWFGKDEYGTFKLLEQLTKELDTRLIGHYTAVRNLASQVIIQAVRNLSQVKNSRYHIPKKVLSDSRRSMVDLYFLDCKKDASPRELADQIGISARQLERIMNEYYGLTFKQKLMNGRLEQAKDILADTDVPIHVIAEQLGYGSASYFSMVFRRQLKMSPQAYREERQARNRE